MRMEKKKGRTAPGINDQVHALSPSNRKSVSYRMTQETERKKSQASQICSAATISRADYSLWTKDFILRGTLAFCVGMETITSFPSQLVQLYIKQLLGSCFFQKGLFIVPGRQRPRLNIKRHCCPTGRREFSYSGTLTETRQNVRVTNGICDRR